jgi:hypothetical protein
MKSYVPVGWRGESHRHYLSSKGVRTVFGRPGRVGSMRGMQFEVERVPQGQVYPLAPQEVADRLSMMPPEDTKGITKVVFQPPKDKMQKQAWAQYKRGKKEIAIFSQSASGDLIDGQPADRVRQTMTEYVLPHEVGHHKALSQQHITDKDLEVAEARADANVLGLSPTDKSVKKLSWHETDKKESAQEYVKRNLKGDGRSPEKKMRDFKDGVKFTLLHPAKDLDNEWKEYTSVADNKYYGPAGRSEPLRADWYGRTVQRGAALFGRVATQANVEPLIDKNQKRTFREVMLDIEFGRRL